MCFVYMHAGEPREWCQNCGGTGQETRSPRRRRRAWRARPRRRWGARCPAPWRARWWCGDERHRRGEGGARPWGVSSWRRGWWTSWMWLPGTFLLIIFFYRMNLILFFSSLCKNEDNLKLKSNKNKKLKVLKLKLKLN